ncbi:MAG: glyoxalase [Candidatus Binatia bacterium]|nr:MAG: glyoxalase [Candidatus Binatia bacterium]
MADGPKVIGSAVIPCLRYRDAPKAIEWLCTTFGFEPHAVHRGSDGTIAHAELRLGAGMIMLASATPNEFGRLMKQPEHVGAPVTQSVYVVVPDVDRVYGQAVRAGATIAMGITDEPHGRGFSCYDPEGHLWSFGTYDPW